MKPPPATRSLGAPATQPLGTKDTFLEAMREEVRHGSLRSGSYTGTRPLADAALGPGDGLLPAFLEATATVLDILSFYEARLEDEAFPPTASLPQTHHALAVSIGAPANFPLPARTWFAFTVRGHATIPAGTPLATTGAGTPVPFETDEALDARDGWNSMRAIVRPSPTPPSGRHVLLESASATIRKGDLVLRSPGSGGTPTLHTVTRVARLGSAAKTLLEVSPDLPEAKKDENVQLSRLTRTRTLAGAAAPPFASAPDSRKLAAGAHRAGGVAVLAKDTEPDAPGAWKPRTQGAPKDDILAVSQTAAGTLLASTASSGLLLWAPGATEWAPGPAIWRSNALRAFALGHQGWLSAAPSRGGATTTQDGSLWTTVRAGTQKATSQPPPVFRSLTDTGTSKPHLLGVSDSAVWTLGKDGWTDCTSGLPDVLRSVASVGRTSFVATSSGIYTGSHGSKWVLSTGERLDIPVVVASGTVVLAAPATGRVIASTDSGKSWADVSGSSGTVSLAATPVVALAVTSKAWLAATRTTLYVSVNQGRSWSAVPSPLPGQVPVAGLAQLPDGGVAAFAAVDGFVETQWPKWDLEADHLDVAGTVSAWEGALVLRQPAGTGGASDTTSAVPETTAVLTPTSLDPKTTLSFGANAPVTRIGVTGTWKPGDFSRAAAQVCSVSAPLPLSSHQPAPTSRPPRAMDDPPPLADGQNAEPSPTPNSDPSVARSSAESDSTALLLPLLDASLVLGSTVEVTGDQRALEGRLVSLSGLPMRVSVQATAVQGSHPVPLVGTLAAFGPDVWLTTDGNERLGGYAASEVRVLGPDTSATTVGAICKVASAAWDGTTTRLSLSPTYPGRLPPLALSTVRVCANVVPATQGRSVSEVIGSGNADKSWASFPLKASPVAGLTTKVPNLDVRVNGVSWSHVASLVSVYDGDRVYTVEVSAKGAASVRFGDGTRGARVPTGAQNVTASYRSGGGAAGNVAAGSAVLLSRPTGTVRSAAHPVAAIQGRDTDSPSATLEEQSATLSFAGTLISASDYRRLLLSAPEVTRAWSGYVLDGETRWLVLGVAGPATGEAVAASVIATLQAAAEAGAVPIPVRVAQAPSRAVGVRVRVVRLPSADSIAAAVTEALLGSFGPGARAIGRTLRLDTIEERVREVPGVFRLLDAHLFDPADREDLGRDVAPARATLTSTGPCPPELVQLAPNHVQVEILG